MNEVLFFAAMFRPFWKNLLLSVLLAQLTMLATVCLMALSGWLITSAAIVGSQGEMVALAFNFIQPGAQIRALAIARTLGRYGERLVGHDATFKALVQIRLWLFRRLWHLAPGALLWRRSGEVLSHLTHDVDALDALFLRIITPLAVASLTLLAVTGFVYSYSPLLSVSLLMVLMIAVVFVPLILKRDSDAPSIEALQHTADFKAMLVEGLQGLPELLSFNAYAGFQRRLLAVSARLLDCQRRYQHVTALAAAIGLFATQWGLGLSIILIAALFGKQQVDGATAVMLVFCVLASFEAVTWVPSALQSWAKTQQAAKRLCAISDKPPTVSEPTTALPCPRDYALSVENLSFRYPEQNDWLFENLNLQIPYGRKIALLGDSGAGKSSLLHVLLRFFDPQHGRVCMGGVDIRQLSTVDYWRCFGLLSQHSRLFAASLAANLRLAKPDARDDELRTALHCAGLDEWFWRLPDGLHSWLDENAANLSGGEQRRLALARLYLQDAPIVLLDEPTEGLDDDTEQAVLATLFQISQAKTVIMATHRRAGLQYVEGVYCLADGSLLQSNRTP